MAAIVHVLVVAGVVATGIGVGVAAIPGADLPAGWQAAIDGGVTATVAVLHALLGYFSTVQPPTLPAQRVGAPAAPQV